VYQKIVSPPHDIDNQSDRRGEAKEATMATISETALLHSLPGWQGDGNRIEEILHLDDFSAAARASLWRSLLGTVAP
jgi:hypothetical protein